MKKLLLVACIAAVTIVSCKKNNEDNSICTTAKVHYGGDPNVDGLGWILLTDSVSFKYEVAENLEDIYKVEGLQVDFCYVVTDVDFICFCPPPAKKKVHLISIRNH
jgi:hypothetical protein